MSTATVMKRITMSVALLTVSALIASPQNPAATRDAFEVVSVKPTGGTASGVGPRGAPGAIPSGPPAVTSCSNRPQVFPGRLLVSNATLYGLITLAYGKPCLLVSGGPQWTRSDTFEIQAVIPEGSPYYTTLQLQNSNAPGLQAMTQVMLEDRFKLAIRREMREMAVLNLVVAVPGKMKLSEDQNPPDISTLPRPGIIRPPVNEPPGPALRANAIAMSRLVNLFTGFAGRPVIDKTNLQGLYDVRVYYDEEFLSLDPVAARFAAYQDQLGLKLEPGRAMVEVLVIDSAERPSAN
jgi:bla regulator protein blaR1